MTGGNPLVGGLTDGQTVSPWLLQSSALRAMRMRCKNPLKILDPEADDLQKLSVHLCPHMYTSVAQFT